MPVTQNYKTVTFSTDAWATAISAVLTVMRDLRRTIGGSPVASEFMDYLLKEVAINTEALTALNAATVLTREDTHGALDGEMLLVVLTELKFVLGMLVDGKFGEGAYTIMRAERIAAALLFLENPK